MTTVAAIVKEAFDAVAAELDVVLSATLIRTGLDRYDTATGIANPYSTPYTVRVVRGEDIGSGKNAFAEIAGAPGDEIFFVEITDCAPQEKDTLCVNGRDRSVIAIKELTGTGAIYEVLVR